MAMTQKLHATQPVPPTLQSISRPPSVSVLYLSSPFSLSPFLAHPSPTHPLLLNPIGCGTGEVGLDGMGGGVSWQGCVRATEASPFPRSCPLGLCPRRSGPDRMEPTRPGRAGPGPARTGRAASASSLGIQLIQDIGPEIRREASAALLRAARGEGRADSVAPRSASDPPPFRKNVVRGSTRRRHFLLTHGSSRSSSRKSNDNRSNGNRSSTGG